MGYWNPERNWAIVLDKTSQFHSGSGHNNYTYLEVLHGWTNRLFKNTALPCYWLRLFHPITTQSEMFDKEQKGALKSRNHQHYLLQHSQGQGLTWKMLIRLTVRRHVNVKYRVQWIVATNVQTSFGALLSYELRTQHILLWLCASLIWSPPHTISAAFMAPIFLQLYQC